MDTLIGWDIKMDGKNDIHKHLYELIVNACYQIRRILKIDDSSYGVYVSNENSPRKYYIHNVLDEIEKGMFSVDSKTEFLLNSKNDPASIKENDQLSSKILKSKIDELSLWRRKFVEILIDLIGFRKANREAYYKHYNLLYEIFRKNKKFEDLERFWAHEDQILKQEISYLEIDATSLTKKLDYDKCWYVKKNKNREWRFSMSDEKSRFIAIQSHAKKYQKTVLITYWNSFGKHSEGLHPKRIVDDKILTLEDLDHAIRGVLVLALHVISAIKDLLGIHNIEGSLKLVANTVKKNSVPENIFNFMTNPRIKVGDFVETLDGVAQVIKICKSEYGYRRFCVKFLIPSTLNVRPEWYVSYNVKMIAPQKELKKKVLKMLQETSPGIKINYKKINSALRDQVLTLSTFRKIKVI